MSGSSKIQILTGSSKKRIAIPKTSNNSQILISDSKKHYTEKDYLIQPNSEQLLKIKRSNNYIVPQINNYLKVDKYLSEFDTSAEKLTVRRNLGIDGIAQWGNVQGYLEDQKDLIDFIDTRVLEGVPNTSPLIKDLKSEIDNIKNDVAYNAFSKVNIENDTETEASKQIQYHVKNPDLNLNSDFRNAISTVLGGSDINSIDDAISVIIHKLFPISYTNWELNISNTASKSYSIEKGTSVTLDPDYTLGTITITISPGNKGDVATSLTVDDSEILEDGKRSYSFNVKVSDITDETTITSGVSKTYTVKLSTSLPRTVQTTTSARISVSTYQYYFYDMGDQRILEINKETAENTTTNEYLFKIGEQEKYLSMFSPVNVTNLFTKAGLTEDGLDSEWRKVTGFVKEEVKYTPQNGTQQKYWLISLEDPQCNYVKVKLE